MKIAMYDATENKPIGWAWAFGAWLFKVLGLVQHVVAAESWADGLQQCYAIAKKNKIREIQFWGHGYPGFLFVNKEALLPNSAHRLLLAGLGEQLEEGALFWFRTCSSFAGTSGHVLARNIAGMLRRRVAGSTFIIGAPWHSGQHSLEPGAIPSWSTEEGLDAKGEPMKSSKKAPNTLFFARMRLPSGW